MAARKGDKKLVLRMDKTTHAALVEASTWYRRSMNSQILRMLEVQLSREGFLTGIDDNEYFGTDHSERQG